ncbi:hypothetical protein FJT64_019738 [Amphibalanus amphitrite]|uniref:Uncharacterized protein n=1 Tax=Amphibalanus amphitrite TaxID=1232801 RepID=A0A6A4WNW9_AMPAM|nr:hypothetical protein FJT64_019738 [Amphibalanus amphitrite]
MADGSLLVKTKNEAQTDKLLKANFLVVRSVCQLRRWSAYRTLLVHLRDVSAENAHVYQYRLWDAKRVKVETAQNRGVSPNGAAGYRDGLRRATNGHPLSAEEVQKVVSRVNQLSS